MAAANDTLGRIRQNLMDAGCDETTVTQCMTFAADGQYSRLLPVLDRYRRSVLDGIHTGQKRLDCLDYLIYQIKREKYEISGGL